ncbi:MAG: GGDEF domain-containing protein [Muricomes sp.]
MSTSILLFFFYAIALFLFQGISVIPAHFFIFITGVIFFIISSRYLKSERKSNHIIAILCLFFEVTVFSFAIFTDIFYLKNGQNLLTPLIYIVFSACFIFPLWQTFSTLLFMEIIYIVLLNLYKSSASSTNDIFISIAGLMISLAVSQIILRFHVESYEVCAHYIELSMTDSLTGILNKKSCENAIQKYLMANTAQSCALLFLDLDNFKNINDYIGHSTGDQILEETGKLLLKSFRTTDIIGRIGGDEFMVLIKDFRDSAEALNKKCDALQEDMCRTMQSFSVDCSCSMGAILFQNQNIDFRTLYEAADEALYRAKQSGKKQCSVCSLPDV